MELELPTQARLSPPVPAPPIQPTATRPRLQLPYLDGIRGLTALYVMLSHIHIAMSFFREDVQLGPALAAAISDLQLPNVLGRLAVLFVDHAFGLPGVQFFIVLSGYCLMLPVVRAGGNLGSMRTFAQRRAYRILPPYYAMIALGLAIHGLMARTGLMESSFEEFHLGSILSHVFLVHNLSEHWYHGIDPPMWSVAVEWQIYFLFPLLLMVWRRFAMTAAVVFAFALSSVPHFFFGGWLDWCHPWFLGLFALGMAAAELGFSENDRIRALNERLPWGWIASGLCASWVWLRTLDGSGNRHFQMISDSLCGLVFMATLVFCTRAIARAAGRPPALPLRILSSKPLGTLGAFSYSLYLVHYPLLMLFFFYTLRFQMPVLARAVLMFGGFVALVLGFAYVFHVAFERPFLRRRDSAPEYRAAEPSPG